MGVPLYAMQIIAELETCPRQIYTDSIGVVSPDRKMQFNVAIRTVLVDKIKGHAEKKQGGQKTGRSGLHS